MGQTLVGNIEVDVSTNINSKAEHSTVQYSRGPYCTLQIGHVSCVPTKSFGSSTWHVQHMVRPLRSTIVASLAVLHRTWNDEGKDVLDDDLVICHNNVIVSLLMDHNLVMDLMDLLCDDGDMSMIQSYVINLRNMFINTMNCSGGESAYNSWKEFNIARQLQTQAEPASRLLVRCWWVSSTAFSKCFCFAILSDAQTEGPMCKKCLKR